jgi:16S rRNA (guanine966-N2)-methyltransferase
MNRRETAATRGHRYEVRIIGGAWRGRKLHFAGSDSVRPTPDRVRETLFNWLQFEVGGRRCLDLFAGSGALGLEALSRGAAECVFVERDANAIRAIRDALAAFHASGGTVEQADAFDYLARPASRPFDLVFLDPPYGEQRLARACARLEHGRWLADGALVYMEDAAAHGPPQLPAHWSLQRSRRAGEVGYHLARRPAPQPD